MPPASDRKGRLARASSATFASLESTAKVSDAKGPYIDRGPHRQAKKMARWLKKSCPEEDELPFGEFAAAQVQVAPEPDCDDSGCEDAACEEDSGPDKVELAGPDDIRDACAHLVAELPSSFREDVRKDALVRYTRRRRRRPCHRRLGHRHHRQLPPTSPPLAHMSHLAFFRHSPRCTGGCARLFRGLLSGLRFASTTPAGDGTKMPMSPGPSSATSVGASTCSEEPCH